jgi:CDP-2,3-bis-(O-geranylgeranyl)-sn-glycerol synthase
VLNERYTAVDTDVTIYLRKLMNIVLFALWFFLPGGIANVVPILAAKVSHLSRWNSPIDGGKKLYDKRLFGPHKTWRGLTAGILSAIIVVYVQQVIYQNNDIGFLNNEASKYLEVSPIVLGFLFGFGALMGDAIESLIKRQRNIDAGTSWFPYDQLDYIIGGCLAVSLVAGISWQQYLVVFAVWFLMHIVFSYIGYLLKLKASPI